MTPTKTRLSAAERRKQILKCAVKVFARSNYYKTKTSDIAREAGVSEAMLYKHFTSKKEIFLTVLRHMSNRIITFWDHEMEPTTSAVETLRAMGLGYYRRMARHPEELKVHFLAISGVDDEDVFFQLRQDYENYIGYVAKVLQQGVDNGEIRPDVDVQALAFVFNGSGIMMNMMHLLRFDPDFNEDKVIYLLDNFLDSILLK